MTTTTLSYTSAGYDGIFDWLGKEKGTLSWAHPETSRGHVVSYQSSDFGGLLSANAFDQLSTDSDRSHTANYVGSYLMWDFGENNAVQITDWALRTPATGDNNPKNFVLEARVEGGDWVTIFTDDGTIVSGTNANTWFSKTGITDTTFYRFFRMRSTGVSWGSQNYMMTGGVEIWGTYSDEFAPQVTGEFWIDGIPPLGFRGETYDGIMQWLGTDKGGEEVWSHPETTHSLVTTSQSTTHAGLSAHNAFDHDLEIAAGRTHTTNVAFSWWKADFGVGNAVRLTQFMLQMQNNTAQNPLTYNIEGSNNDSDWTVLASQDYAATNSETGQKDIQLSSIADTTAWRYIRVYQTDTNRDATNYLTIGEVEMWGSYNATLDSLGTGGGGSGARRVFQRVVGAGRVLVGG